MIADVIQTEFMPRITLRKFTVWFTLVIVIAAISAPWIRYGIRLYRGGLSPSLNVVFVAGGWVEGDVDIHLVDLKGVSVTPEILRAVRDINPARRLDLSNSGINNSSLSYLRELRVDEIDLTGNDIDSASIDNLRQHLKPNCNIIHD